VADVFQTIDAKILKKEQSGPGIIIIETDRCVLVSSLVVRLANWWHSSDAMSKVDQT
jgi:hypothetical protein